VRGLRFAGAALGRKEWARAWRQHGIHIKFNPLRPPRGDVDHQPASSGKINWRPHGSTPAGRPCQRREIPAPKSGWRDWGSIELLIDEQMRSAGDGHSATKRKTLDTAPRRVLRRTLPATRSKYRNPTLQPREKSILLKNGSLRSDREGSVGLYSALRRRRI
jgi:hypothetical protein